MRKNDKDQAGETPASSGHGEPLGTNSEIGRKLKQYYDGIVSEDVPERFQELLKALDTAVDKKVPRS